MNISIFDVVGPIMIGPSSSHTAGAARLGKAAKLIVRDEFSHVSFRLHGSFAQTGKGHGTGKALVAGVLGLETDDEQLAHSFELAKKQGLAFDFLEEEMENVHENTVRMIFTMKDGTTKEIVGSSIGGGQIKICEINGFSTDAHLQLPTLVIQHHDRKGVITYVTRTLMEHNINIASMKLSRRSKGDIACCVLETDDCIPNEVEQKILENENVIYAKIIQLEE